jgi:hypothetical protein
MTTKLLAVLCIVLILPATCLAQPGKKQVLLFDYDKYQLLPDANEKLDSIAVLARKYPSASFVIQGYADSTGNADYNFNLGLLRAKAASRYLEEKGIDTARLICSSYGETKLAYKDSLNFGKNRRVEIFFRPVVRQEIVEQSFELGEKKFENDTIIIGPKGSVVRFSEKAFYPYRMSEIEFNITEVFSKGDIIRHNLSTEDNFGRTLISGGMINIQASRRGKPIGLADSTALNVRIPAGKFDPDMKIYKAVVQGEDTVWQLTDVEIKKAEDGETYYEFEPGTTGLCNVDKPAPVVKEKKNIIVRAFPGYRIYRSYLGSANELALTKGKRVAPHKVTFRTSDWNPDCEVALFMKKGIRNYLVYTRVENLHYQKMWKRYVVRKRDLEKASMGEMNELVARLP